jgi:predicted O-linked N-acetylglucosamine transferase (SPINDLY family)
MTDVDARFRQALAWHHQGDLPAAEAAYRVVLAAAPGHREARANRAQLLGRLGQLEAAMAEYRALAADPGAPAAALLNAGNLRLRQGASRAAVAWYQQALLREPGLAGAYTGLGAAWEALGVTRAAARAYERAVTLDKAQWRAWEGLGLQWATSRPAAEAALTRVVRRRPERVGAWRAQARVRVARGQPAAAEVAFQQAVALAPQHAETLTRAAQLAWDRKALAVGLERLRRAVLADPAEAAAWQNLAVSLLEVHELTQAVQAAARAVALAPTWASPYQAQGNALIKQGRVAEGLAVFAAGEAAASDPEPLARNRAFASLYAEDRTPAAQVAAQQAACRDWPVTPAWTGPVRADGGLRLGYLSPDLHGAHPVAQFLAPVLARHARASHPFVLYATTDTPVDPALAARAEAVHAVEAWDDGALAEQIRGERIDCLIDLAGHTAGSRLRVFGQRAAPVQVSYLGYPATTGYPGCDGLLADPIACPPGQRDAYLEPIIDVATGVFPPLGLDPGQPVDYAGPDGPIVFGNFSQCYKLSPQTLVRWAAVLEAIPGARLRLKAGGFQEAAVREAIARRFAEAGGDRTRLTLVPPSGFTEMLAEYRQIDVVLDTLVYNGGTTTAHALWMGVPVITQPGTLFHTRSAASLIHFGGTDPDRDADIVADAAGYIARAQHYAARVAALRRDRQRLAIAPASHGEAATRALEAALRGAYAARFA